MAELSQKEQLALHEFSTRYRAALAKQHPPPEQSLEIVKDAVREEWEREQTAEREKKPDATKDRQPEPPEPTP